MRLARHRFGNEHSRRRRCTSAIWLRHGIGQPEPINTVGLIRGIVSNQTRGYGTQSSLRLSQYSRILSRILRVLVGTRHVESIPGIAPRAPRILAVMRPHEVEV